METTTAPLARTSNREFATRLAGDMLPLKDVLAVQIFGSISRGEDDGASDLDLIVVATEPRATAWRDLVDLIKNAQGGGSDDHYGPSRAFIRADAFRLIFGFALFSQRYFRPDILTGRMPLYHTPKIDVFVFPPNWQEHGTRQMLQVLGGHKDPEFMNKIARDAISYDPSRNSFPWRN